MLKADRYPAMPPVITSLRNLRVKDAVKLRDRRGREKQGRIIIDGVREIRRALEARVEVTEVFVCRQFCDSAADVLVSDLQRASAEVLDVTPQVLARLAFGDRSEGIVAVARPPRRELADISLGAAPLAAVLEAIEKPGNVGAVLRSADAAGLSAVILADSATDLYNPNAIRASLGTVFTLPVCTATSADAVAWLRRQSLPIFTARVDARIPYTDVDYSSGAAIVLGSESRGLSDVWRGDDITPVAIPMLGAVDSLNVSATAAVLFFEARRQQR